MAITSATGRTWKEFKPQVLMSIVQIGWTILYFITKASFNQGLNPHVYMTYRHIVSAIFMCPFAYFLERKVRPKLTWALFLEIFVLSLLGVSLTLNMYFASLNYTSPTFIASMVNTVPAMTFVIAVLLGMEHLNPRSARGAAKVAGTLASLAGATIMTLYKGPALKNLWEAVIRIHGSSIHESWLKGSILTVASCIAWSISYIMQAVTLRRYPAQLSLTTWMSFLGAAQSAVFTAFVQHNPAAWKIGFDIKLWSILYSGIVCCGLIIYIQLWCTEEKGPVFVTMFNPLRTIIVAVLAFFVFGERLFLGSIIGGVVVIVGLYSVLWGKEKDQSEKATIEHPPFVADQKEHAKAHHQAEV